MGVVDFGEAGKTVGMRLNTAKGDQERSIKRGRRVTHRKPRPENWLKKSRSSKGGPSMGRRKGTKDLNALRA